VTAALGLRSAASAPGWLALATALRDVVHRARAWRAAKRREVEDRHTLAAMSDRDLLDIGVSRASVDELAAGRWVRDWPTQT
jgi:uncharacterized protein YjiS (DUF1127 family)